MEKFTIHSGFFYGAGSIYKWKDDGYHIHGIGVHMGLLLNNDFLEITVKDRTGPIKIGPYILDCAEALRFISKYNSVKVINKSGVKEVPGNQIGVFSKSLLVPKKVI